MAECAPAWLLVLGASLLDFDVFLIFHHVCMYVDFSLHLLHVNRERPDTYIHASTLDFRACVTIAS